MTHEILTLDALFIKILEKNTDNCAVLVCCPATNQEFSMSNVNLFESTFSAEFNELSFSLKSNGRG